MNRREAITAAIGAMVAAALSAAVADPYRQWFRCVGPRSARRWRPISFDDIKPGDFVCFHDPVEWSKAYKVVEGPHKGNPERQITCEEIK